MPLATPISATLQGRAGNQDLIGVGNGTETITGGAVGTDTTATTYIDGGGATALLVGGGQDSVIFGGTGTATLVASSTDSGAPSGFDPFTYAIAGVSFWGEAYSSQPDENNTPYQQTALPSVTGVATSPDEVQINLSLYQSDGTFGTPFGLLGSAYDPGLDRGSSSLRTRPHGNLCRRRTTSSVEVC